MVDQSWPARLSEVVYQGRLLSVRRDVLANDDGSEFDRFTVEHPGAVEVVALDGENRVLLLSQYRATVRRRLVQLPAGVLDVPGESAAEAVVRELAEEADVAASEWEPLLDLWPTPGCSNERWQLFLARGLSPIAARLRHRRRDEEADMERLWVPLPEVIAGVAEGRVMDSMVVAGCFAAAERLAGRASHR